MDQFSSHHARPTLNASPYLRLVLIHGSVISAPSSITRKAANRMRSSPMRGFPPTQRVRSVSKPVIFMQYNQKWKIARNRLRKVRGPHDTIVRKARPCIIDFVKPIQPDATAIAWFVGKRAKPFSIHRRDDCDCEMHQFELQTRQENVSKINVASANLVKSVPLATDEGAAAFKRIRAARTISGSQATVQTGIQK